jgi:hypothetical protein
MEKSMPPLIITIVMPTAQIPTVAICRAIFIIVGTLRKEGERTVNTTRSSRSTRIMP